MAKIEQLGVEGVEDVDSGGVCSGANAEGDNVSIARIGDGFFNGGYGEGPLRGVGWAQ
jgi:hypothetical protein